MNYSARPVARPTRNGKRLFVHMTIANEMRKVTALIDETILAVENAHRSVAHTGYISDPDSANLKMIASRLEGSLKTLRQRRKELDSY